MTSTKTATNGLSILGLGAAACVACCAGPILAFLGGLSIAGLASTWLIGGTGLVIATAAAVGFLLVRRRRQRLPVRPHPRVRCPSSSPDAASAMTLTRAARRRRAHSSSPPPGGHQRWPLSPATATRRTP